MNDSFEERPPLDEDEQALEQIPSDWQPSDPPPIVPRAGSIDGLIGMEDPDVLEDEDEDDNYDDLSDGELEDFENEDDEEEEDLDLRMLDHTHYGPDQ